ncbi:hypothetical protein TCAL_05599 [Tigriopus californicus]|uniref:F-box domain-containing protein n=1 Tax=Tigriopus californicus TaxID=6832 RepID=A0A553NEW4_TIGCA|nr:F-box DNA helicase 1-like [Tigriopus californicus]XP_059094072.1 F-box DNA helicase 1-like [Tigriopus californicus]TRY63909.1 hypothetical protein TCAL_05599 [Tigriopus californicus]|eukprot:TCALIF_05599-PA protein Name:"Similar to FBXO18 F-box only protein 18 (Homo sapiens)" AED:0.08 eAED:0.11 QI:0/-1/0/1/-1/1/1/0/896
MSSSPLMSLPVEIQCRILGQVPWVDLLSSVSLVCRSLRDLVAHPQFIPWKRRYHRYLRLPAESEISLTDSAEFLASIQPYRCLQSGSFNQQELFSGGIEWLLQAITRDGRRKRIPLLIPTDTQNPRLETARQVLTSTLPGCQAEPWSILTLALMLEMNVGHVLSWVRNLCGPNGLLDLPDTLEWLYHVAWCLKLAERHDMLSYRPHYTVFHVIFCLENDLGPSNVLHGEKTLMDRLTVEQKRIVHYPINPASRGAIKVVAFAGTGKTSALQCLVRANPGFHFLCIVFNKVIQDQTNLVFPHNAQAYTINSLSYRFLIEKGYSRTRLKPFSLTAYDVVMSGLVLSQGEGSGNVYTRSSQILCTLRNFACSVDEHIDISHVPCQWQPDLDSPPEALSLTWRERLLADSQNLWKRGITNQNHSVNIEGSFQVKLFQLSKPNLKQLFRCDVILIDEGQDLNPAMLDITLGQDCTKFIVGDPNQQIYGFNGSVNGLALVESFCPLLKSFRLTQSFRFGPEIAYSASIALRRFRQDDTLTVFGRPDIKDNFHGASMFTSARGQNKTVILCRTNISLIQALVKEVVLVPENIRPCISLAQGMASYLDQLVDLAYLHDNQKDRLSSSCRHYFLSLGTFDAYVLRAKATLDKEADVKVQIVKKFSSNLPYFVQVIKKCWRFRDFKDPAVELAFSTVHKFKGLEFPVVRLQDDFVQVDSNALSNCNSTSGDEFNLLYVALTRAQREIVMNRSLLNLMVLSGENFSYFSPNFQVRTCVVCHEWIKPRQNVLQVSRQIVALSSSLYIPGGPICGHCIETPFQPISHVDTLNRICALQPKPPLLDSLKLFLCPLWSDTFHQKGAEAPHTDLKALIAQISSSYTFRPIPPTAQEPFGDDSDNEFWAGIQI